MDAIDFQVSDATIKDAKLCKKNCSCLTDSGKNICKVEKYISNELIFVQPTNNNLCDYRISLGESYVCTCPIRKELYLRYQI